MVRKNQQKLYPQILGAVLREFCGSEERLSVAQRAGVTPATLSRILLGQSATVMQKVELICKALDVLPGDAFSLVTETEKFAETLTRQFVVMNTKDSWSESARRALGEAGFTGLLSFAAARCRSQLRGPATLS